jgi:hypothetical protein
MFQHFVIIHIVMGFSCGTRISTSPKTIWQTLVCSVKEHFFLCPAIAIRVVALRQCILIRTTILNVKLSLYGGGEV